MIRKFGKIFLKIFSNFSDFRRNSKKITVIRKSEKKIEWKNFFPYFFAFFQIETEKFLSVVITHPTVQSLLFLVLFPQKYTEIWWNSGPKSSSKHMVSWSFCRKPQHFQPISDNKIWRKKWNISFWNLYELMWIPHGFYSNSGRWGVALQCVWTALNGRSVVEKIYEKAGNYTKILGKQSIYEFSISDFVCFDFWRFFEFFEFFKFLKNF